METNRSGLIAGVSHAAHMPQPFKSFFKELINSIRWYKRAANLQSHATVLLSSEVEKGFGFRLVCGCIGTKPTGVLGLLSIPSALVFSIGIVLKETRIQDFSYNQVHEKFLQANKSMWSALKCPEVWRPCLYMYLSLALSLDISVGMFYWYSNPTAGPAFSESFIGLIYSVGSIGSLLGVLLYQSKLKDHPFRSVFLWAQILTSMSGMLDLLFLLRLNLNLHIPDHLFGVIDSGISSFVGNLKWMPLMILSYKLCPPGVEGTFFALLMSIDNAGFLTSSWAGGLLLHLLKVTRDEFGNLWIAVLVRNFSRLLPLGFLFLIPTSDQNFAMLPSDIVLENSEHVIEKQNDIELEVVGEESELVSLIGKS
ncbi:putative folate-biopterin transporter 2 [Carex littledalei]|uniref:Putative folate-biopterin transporter 2 n=1 Tax=Carex littledalei TaxID=544730 RepID=A0A833VZL1_9POAL|nr:putative folate-biopterin transporter 2 [Carex littledalei]